MPSTVGNIAPSRRVQDQDTIRISVMTMAGKVLFLDVRPMDTLGHVKTEIHGELGVPPSRQRLVFAGKALQDEGRTLADYGVDGKTSSCLHLAIRRWPGRGSGWMEVFVKVPSGRTLSVMVERSDTVWRIMETVRESEGVPVLRQRVVYCGKQLEDGRTMEEYGVRKESILHVILRLGGPHSCADFARR